MLTPADSQRFWSKVDQRGNSDCWLWTASRIPGGYGQFVVRGRPEKAHRVAYSLTHGPIPRGAHVLHSCDIPHCVNPAHLALGSPVENMRDRQVRGRQRHPGPLGAWERAYLEESLRGGAYHTDLAATYGVTLATVSRIAGELRAQGVILPTLPQRTKDPRLTPEQIRAVRAATHLSQRALARRYGVSESLIGRIRRRVLWRHIPDDVQKKAG